MFSGCIVHAFDPTDVVIRPKDSYIENLHFHHIGIWHQNGKDSNKPWLVKTLQTILMENGDIGKNITYLKMDVEGSELFCFKDWFDTHVFKAVQQFGIEFHVQSGVVQHQIKKWYRRLNGYLKKLYSDYNFQIIASEPNTCLGKVEDLQKIHYSYNDVLLVKKS